MRKSGLAILAAAIVVAILYFRIPSNKAGDKPLSVQASAQSAFYITAQEEVPVSFSCEELELRIGMESGTLKGITIISLPSEQEGKLLLDGEPAPLYEPISRGRSQGLTMIPASGAARAGFSFLPQAPDSVPATVYVNITGEGNMPPEAGELEIRTIRDIPVSGYVSAWDPDGDGMSIVITRKPEKGTAQAAGLELTYKPYAGKKGRDSLKLSVRDERGAYSNEIEVSIRIENSLGLRFADMMGSTGEYAALKLHKAGIMTGERIGGNWLFYPDRELTHSDFITLLLTASGMDAGLSMSVNTGLLTDSLIPSWQKPYVKASMEAGILIPEKFYPDLALTRAQAVEYIDRAAGKGSGELYSLRFAGAGDIPASSLASYARLESMKLPVPYSVLSQPSGILTRADAARLLWSVYENRDLFKAR